MTKRAYRGETDSKAIARSLVWWQHQRLLKGVFKTTPHVFLASRTGKDAEFLLDSGLNPKLVWAVESDRVQYLQLIQLKRKWGFVLHTSLVESVVEKHAETASLRSVYLDYCGTLEGTRSSTRRVVSRLPPNSVVSLTVLRGRELSGSKESREKQLLRQLQEASPHRVSLVQTILYVSEDADTLGSPMMTLTFFLGDLSSRGKMRFDLTRDLVAALSEGIKVRAFWDAAVAKALRRSRAATLANQTRR